MAKFYRISQRKKQNYFINSFCRPKYNCQGFFSMLLCFYYLIASTSGFTALTNLMSICCPLRHSVYVQFNLYVCLYVMLLPNCLNFVDSKRQISCKWTHHIATFLFFGFGLWSLWDAFHEEGHYLHSCPLLNPRPYFSHYLMQILCNGFWCW